MMTGRVPDRHGLHRPPMYGEPGGLQGVLTIAELLSQAGYRTQEVGKWHLGESETPQPQNVGFDDFYGSLSVSDMYSGEAYLGKSPARHPYKDTLLELDQIAGRLFDTLTQTGQIEDTLIFITSDNGPHMETWPDAAYTPFRCAKGSTWEGGVRVPGLMVWPLMVSPTASITTIGFRNVSRHCAAVNTS